jgi:hypothetical protein
MKDPFFLGFLISAFGLFLLLINVICFALTKKKFTGNKIYNVLFLYLLFYFLIELFCNIIGFLKPNSNIFVSHYAFNVQFLFLSIFFYLLFKESILKKMVVAVFFAFISINLYLSFEDPELYWKFNLFEIVAISLVTLVYTLIHLYNNLGEKKNYFYFTIGVSMYMLSTSIIFLLGNVELVFIKDPYIDIWVFNSIFFIVYQFLIFKEWRYLNLRKKNE